MTGGPERKVIPEYGREYCSAGSTALRTEGTADASCHAPASDRRRRNKDAFYENARSGQ